MQIINGKMTSKRSNFWDGTGISRDQFIRKII